MLAAIKRTLLLLATVLICGCGQQQSAVPTPAPPEPGLGPAIVWDSSGPPAPRQGFAPAPVNPIFELVAEFAPAFQDESGAGIPPALAGLAVDGAGSVFVSDQSASQVIRISPRGQVERFAGNGTRSNSGDGGPALLAGLRDPGAIAADVRYGVYIASTSQIRHVAPDGTISLLAGSDDPGMADDPAGAGTARFNSIAGLALDGAGVLYVADRGNNRIRRVDRNGAVTTVGGTGAAMTDGDGGPARLAQFDGPADLAVAADGAIYVSELGGHVVRRIGPDGLVSTVAGIGLPGRNGDGGPALAAQLDSPLALAIDSADYVYVADWKNSAIRVITTGGTISTYAGLGTAGSAEPGVPAREAVLPRPVDIALGPDGAVYLLPQLSGRIYRLVGFGDPVAGEECRLAPQALPLPIDLPASTVPAAQLFGQNGFGFAGDDGPVAAAQFAGPDSIAVGRDGYYVADTGNNRVRMVVAGRVETIAGSGVAAFRGDGGLARFALLSSPKSILADAAGNVFFFDAGNFRIRRIDGCGVIETLAGSGRPGDPGSGGPALEVDLLDVAAMVMAPDGSIFLADSAADRVLRLTPAGSLELVAGNGQDAPAVTGSPAGQSPLADPAGLALTADNMLLIAENGSGRILALNSETGALAVHAVDLQDPGSLAVSAEGTIYVAGESAGRLDRIDADGIRPLIDSSGIEDAILDPVLVAPRSLALTGGRLLALGASGAAWLLG